MSASPNHPRVPFPPPLVFLGALTTALILNVLVPLRAPWPAGMRIAGMLCAVVGFAIAASAFRRLVGEGTSPDPRQPTTALSVQGPYRFTRNPIYLGFALAYVGFTLIANTLWGLVLAPLLILLITRLVIAREEEYLTVRFGDRYADYLSRVRRWL